jgi:hypothetical protein
MSDDTPSSLNSVTTIDDERIKSHLDRVVRGTVALNALLDLHRSRRSLGHQRHLCIRHQRLGPDRRRLPGRQRYSWAPAY